MKNKTFCLLLAGLALVWASSCSGGGGSDEPVVPPPAPEDPTPPVEEKIPILLDLGVNGRATDTAFEKGDKVGLYVVNYSGTAAGALQTSGNHMNNVGFTFNGTSWTAASAIYWKDETTPADFYCYYPFATVADVTAHSFSVKADQSTVADYKASEFLYGKAANVAPTENAVNVMTNHLLSCAVITVAPGNGFTAESLAAAAVSVKLNGCKTTASIDLKDGSVQATGEAAAITPLKEENQYKALVVPQSVSADNFITVTVDGRDYNLKKNFTFQSKMRHTFTVTVSKTSSGVNVGITGWEDDEVDNGGVAE